MLFKIISKIRGIFFPNYAVLLIDMQDIYLNDLAEGKRQVIINNQRSLLKKCIEKDIPVCVMEFIRHEKTIEELSDLLEKVPRKEILKKDRNDSFTNANLQKILKKWRVGKLILAGVFAGACVRDTAQSARHRGYAVMTSFDLIDGWSSYREEEEDWYKIRGMVMKSVLSLIMEQP